jgi:tRNA dimethylallyltransferase
MAILIAGMTACGKSRLALSIAQAVGGVIINADALQVYSDWVVLTACPKPEKKAEIPHKLYNHISGSESYSVQRWLDDVQPVLAWCQETNTVPIVVGGTGLYFHVLTQGLSPIPAIPAHVREEGMNILHQEGVCSLFQSLQALDPETAACIDSHNSARVLRAWEVVTGTGRGMTSWWQEQTQPILPFSKACSVVLTSDLDWVEERCLKRLHSMLENHVLDEIQAFEKRYSDQNGMSAKALGRAEFASYLRGEISLEKAVFLATKASRLYAKRQKTWLNKYMKKWRWFDAKDVGEQTEEYAARVVSMVSHREYGKPSISSSG